MSVFFLHWEEIKRTMEKLIQNRKKFLHLTKFRLLKHQPDNGIKHSFLFIVAHSQNVLGPAL